MFENSSDIPFNIEREEAAIEKPLLPICVHNDFEKN